MPGFGQYARGKRLVEALKSNQGSNSNQKSMLQPNEAVKPQELDETVMAEESDDDDVSVANPTPEKICNLPAEESDDDDDVVGPTPEKVCKLSAAAATNKDYTDTVYDQFNRAISQIVVGIKNVAQPVVRTETLQQGNDLNNNNNNNSKVDVIRRKLDFSNKSSKTGDPAVAVPFLLKAREASLVPSGVVESPVGAVQTNLQSLDTLNDMLDSSNDADPAVAVPAGEASLEPSGEVEIHMGAVETNLQSLDELSDMLDLSNDADSTVVSLTDSSVQLQEAILESRGEEEINFISEASLDPVVPNYIQLIEVPAEPILESDATTAHEGPDIPFVFGDIEENNVITIPIDNPVEEPNLPTVEKKKLTRKRSRNPTETKEAKAKKALYRGEAHRNKSGQFRPAPVMKLPCACRFKCSLKISEQDRVENFETYNQKMGCKDKQWAFIRALSSSGPVKKNTVTNRTPKKSKQVSRQYFLRARADDGSKHTVKVCKVMFMNTLSIWDGVIDSAYKHINPETKTPTPDKRGRHSNRPRKTTEAQKETVRNHISKYPRVPSHYVRAKSNKEYFEHGLNCKKMYRQYKTWCEEENIPAANRATERQYKTVLDYEYNIGFFKPKKDRCQLCVLMKTATRRERDQRSALFVTHIKNKKGAYKELREARKLLTTRRDVTMLCFDLQKVLPCPKSDTSVFFYLNKLSVYNLTVYSSREHQGECFLWHSGNGKRGSNEIGTCVMKAYTEAAKAGAKEIISFSDSCSGQNKNRYIYSMMMVASAQLNIKIKHVFLEPGHTYNDADGVHGRIETASDGTDIYDLDEWVQMIKSAKVEEPMYKVQVLKRLDFLDLKDLVEKQNWDKDTNGKKITWNKVKVIEAGYHDDPGKLALQYGFDVQRVFLNTNQRRGHPVNLKTYRFPIAYPEKILLKQLVVTHLTKLCKSLAIPSKYHKFYDDVINNVEPTEENDDPDDEQIVSDSVDPDCLVDELGQIGCEYERERRNEEDEDEPGEENGEGHDGENEHDDEDGNDDPEDAQDDEDENDWEDEENNED